jgi:hypothetical protein
MHRHECDNRHDAVADAYCEVSSSNPNCLSKSLKIDKDAKGSVTSFLSIRLSIVFTHRNFLRSFC